MHRSKQNEAKPFIKWVGGKTQLLADIEKYLPVDLLRQEVTYVEPFVGGGSVLFWILQRFPNIKRAVINDINPKLINTYQVVKDNSDELIACLHTLEDDYLPLNQEDRTAYFLERRKQFNTSNLSCIEYAALFIFLNKTCFNGLYRENAKGLFNVPHGRYDKLMICNEETIRADAELLQRVEIMNNDFAATEVFADEHTFFYFDPPYKPLNDTSSFNSYVKERFDDAEQIRLKDFCTRVASKGSKFILSNSDVRSVNPANNFFDNLYSEYIIHRVMATRMVNSKADKRGKLTELMISNVKEVAIPNLFNI